jgi:beta-glucosidase
MAIQALLVTLTAAGLLRSSSAQDVIESDSYFYEQSPPVYPTPQISGLGDWAASYAKASSFVAQLSLEEKSNLTFGVASTTNGCSGNIPPITRLGFPGMCLQDAGNGVRATDVSEICHAENPRHPNDNLADFLPTTVRQWLCLGYICGSKLE